MVAATDGGTIEGNLIGTDFTGTLGVPNGTGAELGGVVLEEGTSDVTVGGTTAAARNVISGNDGSGITITSADLEVSVSPGPFALVILGSAGDGLNQANMVEGNFIGVAAGGSSALPNSGDGIDDAATALNTVIGGTATGAGNVVSGNAGNGVDIDGSGLPGDTPLYLKADGNTSNSASVPALPVGGATLVGGVTYGPGITGQAWDFNDTPGELVSVSDPSNNLAANAVTLSAWINLSNLPGSTPYVIASHGYSSSGENYGLYVNSSGELVFQWYGLGGFHSATSSGAALGSRLGVFQQIAVTAAGQSVSFYVNGALVSSIFVNAFGGAGSGNLEIGGLSQGSNLFNGLIDDVSVTLALLPPDEIARIYTNGGVGTDLGGSGTEDTTVAGNFIGTNAAGTAAIGNDGDGILINASGANTVGGTAAGAGNVISGNTRDGVEISGSGASSNVVDGNLIGTSADGETAIGDRDDDIGIDDGASGNTIGGLTTKPGTGAGNLLSGSIFSNGITVEGGGSNLIEGNLIGTDLAGSTALGNTYDGIRLQNSSHDTIGGTAAGAGNVISGNGQFNVWLNSASDETVQGNDVGTDVTGSFALSSSTFTGVEILDSSDNLIGGTAPGAGNVISGNGDYGVLIGDYDLVNPATTVDNIVEGNLIGLNAGGTAAVPNGDGGVFVGPSLGTQIGGTASGAGNVISGNQAQSSYPGFNDPAGIDGAGIEVENTPGVAITDNRIGTTKSGTQAVPNQGSGIYLENSAATITGNQIAGNAYDGITVQGNSACGPGRFVDG